MKIKYPVATSPYLVESPPTSPGRALLSRAYEHYSVLQWGWSGEQIASAFAGNGDAAISDAIAWSTRLLGELIAAGEIRTWARPFGGGEPLPIKANAWELDDFRTRFASSALDPKRPFDADAPASHWVFVDLDDWNRMVEASLGLTNHTGGSRPPSGATQAHPVPKAVDADAASARDPTCAERLIRRDEVERRTGLSRATIYRRILAGTFPKQKTLSGNIAVWRESELAAWIADPR